MRTPYRIVTVADHSANFADFLTSLEAQPDLTVVAAVPSASFSFSAVSQQKPDLVILSLGMSDHRILELGKDLTVLHPRLKILIFTRHDHEMDAARVLRAGAHGCVAAGSCSATKLAAIRQVLAGTHYFASQPAPRPSAPARALYALHASPVL